jgi:hypothetical protein
MQNDNILIRTIEAARKGFKLINCNMQEKPSLAYVGGAINLNNLGDEVIYSSLRSIFKQYNFVHYDGCRTQEYLLSYYPFIKKGLLAGGTLINQYEVWLTIANQYQNICPNLYVFGTGVANPSFWNSQKDWRNRMAQWKKILLKCKYIGVRGPISAELLDDAGIKNVEVVGDPVISLAVPEINEHYNSNSIGLNIGQSKGRVWGNETSILEQFIKLAKHVKKADLEVHWFVVCPEDLKITYKAAFGSETTGNIHVIYENENEYINLVKNMSVFVGMKLHAVILATCAYVPSVMLEYRPKCFDYMKSIDHGEFNISTDKFNGDEVWHMVSILKNRRKQYAERLFSNVKILQKHQLRKYDDLLKIMNS